MEEDRTWVNQCLKGDQQAFRHLVERYQDFVFTIAMRVVKERETAEEVAQDAFVKAYQNLSAFKGKSKFSTWLYAIAYRTAIDHTRKSSMATDSLDREESHLQLEETDKRADQMLEDADLKDLLLKVIHQLSPVDANLITLFYLQECSVKEISEITGMSVSNIKTKLHRLREALRKQFAPQLKQLYIT